jgi:insulysin
MKNYCIHQLKLVLVVLTLLLQIQVSTSFSLTFTSKCRVRGFCTVPHTSSKRFRPGLLLHDKHQSKHYEYGNRIRINRSTNVKMTKANNDRNCEECQECQECENMKESSRSSFFIDNSTSNDKDCKSNNKEISRREVLYALSISSSILHGAGGAAQANAAVAVDEDDIMEENISAPNSNSNYYPPIIPFSSVRQQKLITLSNNGLKVLVVNDSMASQSTAALIIHGPGQFQDPNDLPGTAHLMEHMIMSYKIKGSGHANNIDSSNDDDMKNKGKKSKKNTKETKNTEDNDGDLEDWLGDFGGASNAFTAYDQTCFHLNCPHDVLPSALEQFATIFVEDNVKKTCYDDEILKREIRRVDDELDLDSVVAQQKYLTKSFINKIDTDNDNNDDEPHPYSKFSRGSLETLETIPKERGIDVSKKLIDFFQEYYLPTQAVLVVVSNLSSSQQTLDLVQPLRTIESWVSTTFDKTLSTSVNGNVSTKRRYHYPAQFKRKLPYNHMVLHHKGNEGNEKMTLQWVLNEDYEERERYNGRYKESTNANASEIAFVLNQILGRRGPGSFYQYLRDHGWIHNKSTLPPQVTIPMNVSGFQILRMELSLTQEGFLNRSKVASAVFEAIETMRNRGMTMNIDDSFLIPGENIAQYASMAKLFGYLLAPRPPDAVELAYDSMTYGVETVETGKWYRFPSTDDMGEGMDGFTSRGLNRIQRSVNSALKVMSDPKNAMIVVTTGEDTGMRRYDSRNNGMNDIHDFMPSFSSEEREKYSNTKVYLDDMMASLSSSNTGRQSKYTNNGNRRELSRPLYNSLIPTSIYPPRVINTNNISKKYDPNVKNTDRNKDSDSGWTVLVSSEDGPKMQMPRSPPEVNCRGVFVLQLLSSRPIKANAEQAAYGELWRLSIEEAVADLAEQGASGGLAYETRFNQYGMRISFMGPSQTLQSYAKRMMQLLVEHQMQLLKGKRSLRNRSIAIADANKATDLSLVRRKSIINTLQKAKQYDVALEGIFFLRSCSDAVCFSQGDVTPDETRELLDDLRQILAGSVGGRSNRGKDPLLEIPSIDDLINLPTWKPRNASPCYVPGVSLMSDACGRILR